MAKRQLPEISILTSVLSYDKDTGLMTWKERPLSDFNCQRICNAWNAKHIGKTAGYYLNGKVYVKIFGRTYLAHRIAWVMGGMEIPPDNMHIDHINGNPQDNRIVNLRVVTNQQNCFNRSKGSKRPRSISGVHWNERDQYWSACIRKDYKTIHLGKFNSKGEAAVAAAKASLRHFGKYSPYWSRYSISALNKQGPLPQ